MRPPRCVVRRRTLLHKDVGLLTQNESGRNEYACPQLAQDEKTGKSTHENRQNVGIFLNFFDSFFRFHFHTISPNSSPSHLSVLLSSLIRCDAFGASFLFLYLVSSFFSPLLAMSALPSLFIDSPPSSFFVFTFVVAIQMYFNLKIERNSRFPLLVFRFLARFWLLHPRNLI